MHANDVLFRKAHENFLDTIKNKGKTDKTHFTYSKALFVLQNKKKSRNFKRKTHKETIKRVVNRFFHHSMGWT